MPETGRPCRGFPVRPSASFDRIPTPQKRRALAALLPHHGNALCTFASAIVRPGTTNSAQRDSRAHPVCPETALSFPPGSGPGNASPLPAAASGPDAMCCQRSPGLPGLVSPENSGASLRKKPGSFCVSPRQIFPVFTSPGPAAIQSQLLLSLKR